MMTELSTSPASAAEEFPDWFTLRGHAGIFRIDKLHSGGGVIVLANVNGREVGRCSANELHESIDGPPDGSSGRAALLGRKSTPREP